MPRTGAGGLGGLAGLWDGVAGGRVARRGLSHTSHKMLLAAFTIVQLLQCHSEKTQNNAVDFIFNPSESRRKYNLIFISFQQESKLVHIPSISENVPYVPKDNNPVCTSEVMCEWEPREGKPA